MWERRREGWWVVRDALGQRCPFIGARGWRRLMTIAGISGETGGSVNGELSSLKLQFKGGVTAAV
jgi:hypothetical protein